MADNWTYVQPKKGKSRKAVKDYECCSSCANKNTFDKDATLETLKRDLNRWTADWQRTDLMKEVKRTIKNLHLEDRDPINKAICMGVGNLATIHMENLGRSFRQLSVFIEIVKHLEQKSGTPVKMYVQEPRLYELDKEFFKTLDIEVVEWEDEVKEDVKQSQLGPIEAYLDQQTFVADFFVEWSVTAHLADYDIGLLITAWPAIAARPEAFDEEQQYLMADRIKIAYQCFEFPMKSFEPMALSGLYICGLKDVWDDEE